MLRSIQPKQDWNQRVLRVLKEAPKLKKLRVLAGFNAVTDYIKFVDSKTVLKAFSGLDEAERKKALDKSQSDANHLTHPRDFLAQLFRCMRIGKAGLVVASPEVLKWLDDAFGAPDEKRLGGQAALMAAQLSELGARACIYPANLSVDQAKLIPDDVCVPVADKKKLKLAKPLKAARPEDPTQTSWIFEFTHGQVLELPGERIECPRQNRLIVAYPSNYTAAFKKDMEPALPKLAKQIDVLLVSGYHALDAKTAKKELATITDQLKKMRNANKKIQVHYEFVPYEDDAVGKAALKALSGLIDSMGMNEVELVNVLKLLGFKKNAQDIEKHECAETLYEGAAAVLEKLRLQRVHVHSLGYNVLVVSKKVDADAARDGALFGSAAATVKSTTGKLGQAEFSKEVFLKISETGYNQIGQFESSIWDSWQKKKRKPISSLLRKQFMSSGIFDEQKTHTAIIVPAPVATGLKTTVGLGDVVSACAIAFQAA
ncbi:hypothetical protein HY572_01540 [Candidatus Micrarchaeota archaeon]|nr:hypothetical protein [Candidatus Micrarchaeota archaeon]